MAAPEQLLQLMQQGSNPVGGMGAAAPGAFQADMSDESTPPMSAPMSTPEPKMGSIEGARITLANAADLLQTALPAFGVETEEGKQVLEIIGKLTKILGAKEDSVRELVPAQILNMLQTLPQGGGATPEQKAMTQAPTVPGMAMAGGQPQPTAI